MRFADVARYAETVAHLRLRQVAARLWFAVSRPGVPSGRTLGVRALRGRLVPPIAPEPSMVAQDAFRFLNVERRCASGVDWHPPDMPKLWTYNLHYFDDLNARQAGERRAWHERLLERWVEQNPPGRGDAWEPYPVSRRIVNWVKWALRGNTLHPRVLDSLCTQVRWLGKHVEYHILGNHLLANAKALLYAGAYCDGPEADAWHARGKRILNEELVEQILPDGGHFELSTMYQATVLEDLLDIINLERAMTAEEAPAAWIDAAARMRRWLEKMTHADGQISFFNDAAFGVAPTPAEIALYCARLSLAPLSAPHDQGLTVLESSGYVRASIGAAVLVCDCAEVGPDYLPGHAHADTLSFELSLFGQRVLVNSGTSQYGTGPERERQRSTRAHNTVVVNGENSSDVWAGFRVARRAHCRLLTAAHDAGCATIVAQHNGYRRMPGHNLHRRLWALDESGLRIEDEITGEHTGAVAFLHVHPDVDVQLHGEDSLSLHLARGRAARVTFAGAGSLALEAGTWHPEFGRSVPNRHACVRFAKKLVTRVSWSDTA